MKKSLKNNFQGQKFTQEFLVRPEDADASGQLALWVVLNRLEAFRFECESAFAINGQKKWVVEGISLKKWDVEVGVGSLVSMEFRVFSQTRKNQVGRLYVHKKNQIKGKGKICRVDYDYKAMVISARRSA
jgi:hypothetical protein